MFDRIRTSIKDIIKARENYITAAFSLSRLAGPMIPYKQHILARFLFDDLRPYEYEPFITIADEYNTYWESIYNIMNAFLEQYRGVNTDEFVTLVANKYTAAELYNKTGVEVRPRSRSRKVIIEDDLSSSANLEGGEYTHRGGAIFLPIKQSTLLNSMVYVDILDQFSPAATSYTGNGFRGNNFEAHHVGDNLYDYTDPEQKTAAVHNITDGRFDTVFEYEMYKIDKEYINGRNMKCTHNNTTVPIYTEENKLICPVYIKFQKPQAANYILIDVDNECQIDSIYITADDTNWKEVVYDRAGDFIALIGDEMISAIIVTLYQDKPYDTLIKDLLYIRDDATINPINILTPDVSIPEYMIIDGPPYYIDSAGVINREPAASYKFTYRIIPAQRYRIAIRDISIMSNIYDSKGRVDTITYVLPYEIVEASLQYESMIPNHTSIEAYLSFDGGVHYIKADGTISLSPPYPNTVKCRFVLKTSNPHYTPYIKGYKIDVKFRTTAD